MELTNDKNTPDSADVRYSTLITKINNYESMIIDMHNNMTTIMNNLMENRKQSSNIDSTIKSISNSINITNSNTTKIYDALLERLNNNETLIKDIQNNINRILDKLTELNNIFTLINHESDTSSSGSAFPDEKFTEITAKLDETRSSLDKLKSLLSTLSIQNIE